MRRVCVITLLVAQSLVGEMARAAPLVVFDWDVPAGGPTAEEVVAIIATLLGDRAAADRRVRGWATVTREGDGWRLHLITDVEGTRGRRELSGGSCRELAEVAALILAMASDPSALTEGGGPQADSDAEPRVDENVGSRRDPTHVPVIPTWSNGRPEGLRRWERSNR
jgi:hypothetical protein